MKHEIEERVVALAVRQHGVVTRSQLIAAGVSTAAIGRGAASLRLRRLHRGVYLIGPIYTGRAREMAAALSGGPDAHLSHLSAARLIRLRATSPAEQAAEPVDVSIPGIGRARRPGIRYHRTAALGDDERAVVDAVPVTTPARTLVDIAGILGIRAIEQAVATAEREGLISPQELAGLPDRYPRRRGMAALRGVLREPADPAFTRSPAERVALELFLDAGFPRPHTNVRYGPFELDLFWPELGTAIEIDGWAHHSSRSRFDADRRKDLWLESRGIEVIRLSWRQITREPVRIVAELAPVLARARERRGVAGPAGRERRLERPRDES